MKTLRLLSGMTVGLLIAVSGCSDDDDSGGAGGSSGSGGSGGTAGASTGGTGGGTGGSAGASTGGTAGAGTGGSAGASGSAGAGGSAGASGLSCAAYCTAIMANCTNENAQYASEAVCLTVCNSFPVGTASDANGNTLGCRTYHASAAGSGTPADATLHCPHAGPAGDGLCGTNCEGYCNIMVDACPGEFSGGETECLNECGNFADPNNTHFTTAETTGDTVHCRIYHASVASENSAAGLTHCPHAGVNPTDFCQ